MGGNLSQILDVAQLAVLLLLAGEFFVHAKYLGRTIDRMEQLLQDHEDLLKKLQEDRENG